MQGDNMDDVMKDESSHFAQWLHRIFWILTISFGSVVCINLIGEDLKPLAITVAVCFVAIGVTVLLAAFAQWAYMTLKWIDRVSNEQILGDIFKGTAMVVAVVFLSVYKTLFR